MRTRVIHAKDYTKRILRHRLNAKWLGDKIGKVAETVGDWRYEVWLGFDPSEAPSNGSRPDMVECCLVISNPLGLSLAILAACSGRIYAKATAADICVPGAGRLWSRGSKDQASVQLRALHADYWNEMETLGAMAAD